MPAHRASRSSALSPLLFIVPMLAGACQSPTGTPSMQLQARAMPAIQSHDHQGTPGDLPPERSRQIARVRSATAQFRDVNAAIRAGYTVQYPVGCATSADGAQGFHYLNPTLAADTVIDPLTPELLMYEPNARGQLELIGVDYVIKYTSMAASTRPKPKLMGLDMMNNDALGVWALHIWTRRPNPSGMFAMWNPRVSCRYAGAAKLPELPQ